MNTITLNQVKEMESSFDIVGPSEELERHEEELAKALADKLPLVAMWREDARYYDEFVAMIVEHCPDLARLISEKYDEQFEGAIDSAKI